MPGRSVMTGKERIMASLRGEETDHVSWAPLIDPYYTAWLATRDTAALMHPGSYWKTAKACGPKRPTRWTFPTPSAR